MCVSCKSTFPGYDFTLLRSYSPAKVYKRIVDRPTMFHGKTHDFDWAMASIAILVITYQRLFISTSGVFQCFSHDKVGGTPKSSIFMGFSIINQPIWRFRIYGNPTKYIYIYKYITIYVFISTINNSYKYQYLPIIDTVLARPSQAFLAIQVKGPGS